MYQLIPAEESHLDQIVPLLASTGYWEAGLRRNQLNLPTHQFIREYVAKPNLAFTTIVVRKGDEKTVLGLLTCGTKQELDSCAVDYGDHIPMEIKQLFKNLFTFEIANSYHIAFLALNKTSRGQGLGVELMYFAEKKWKESQLETLSLYTFSCQTDAIKLYLKTGMMITDVFNVDDKVPCPCVLYFEKNTRTAAMQNYFETSVYQNLAL
ncbi:TDP-fucosamine acetyltransferase [Legionella nautarum]|uniref:TDP-fucosamine acetyltransferase n=1 Tax=Legionella nautarum TaxID=45070 RepID=A0A0W0WML1_9GAMM|nr:GNAT family N-acetyltransferase [Legionella nautarum]KTD33568.1 TDP-fucosamine acetyltransferase [Legionella nautarum]